MSARRCPVDAHDAAFIKLRKPCARRLDIDWISKRHDQEYVVAAETRLNIGHVGIAGMVATKLAGQRNCTAQQVGVPVGAFADAKQPPLRWSQGIQMLVIARLEGCASCSADGGPGSSKRPHSGSNSVGPTIQISHDRLRSMAVASGSALLSFSKRDNVVTQNALFAQCMNPIALFFHDEQLINAIVERRDKSRSVVKAKLARAPDRPIRAPRNLQRFNISWSILRAVDFEEATRGVTVQQSEKEFRMPRGLDCDSALHLFAERDASATERSEVGCTRLFAVVFSPFDTKQSVFWF